MAKSLRAACQGRSDRAVEAVVSLWKALWKTAKQEDDPLFKDAAFLMRRATVRGYLQEELASRRWALQAGDRKTVEGLLIAELPQAEGEGCDEFLKVLRNDFCLFSLVERVLNGSALACDLQYWAARDLRRSRRVVLSAAAVHSVHKYTRLLKGWLETLGDEPVAHHSIFLIASDLQQDDPEGGKDKGELPAESYFELAAAMGWVWPVDFPGEVAADPSLFDAEKLIGRYFGMPTAIPGLDAIFGGSGILIVDSPELDGDPEGANNAQPIGGRVIVITGPYGSGKSTLALELGIDIARKGGVVIVAAMEQSPEECLYSMESLGISTSSSFFTVVHEMRQAIPLFSQTYTGSGILAFLPIQRPAVGEGQFDEFLKLLKARFEWMQGFPVRLIIIDPMNSVLAREEEGSEQRHKLLDMFWEAKRLGINLCLTRERLNDAAKDTPFEENIADTVLHVATSRRASVLRRAVEIRKSRLQREETGRHDLVMMQATGLRIFPSSSAVARTASLELRKARKSAPTYTGVDGIDRLLGDKGLFQGDIIALDGEPGSSRTLLGAHFLFVQDHSTEISRPKSLFISDADLASMMCQLEMADKQRRARPAYEKKALEDIIACPLVADSMEPSQILQAIKDQFEEARSEGRTIDRVLLADVSRWDEHHDLPDQDETFGHALLALFRSYGATCMLMADSINSDQRSVVREVIVDSADCILKFEKADFRGQLRQFVRVTKSREMVHRRDLYEMVVQGGAVDVNSTGVLLRKDENGTFRKVPIRLFLHADTPHHYEFNAKVIGSIKTSITDAIIDEQWSHYDPEMFAMSGSSAVDEVQIMQLDEYQLPSTNDPEVNKKFYIFEPDDADPACHEMGQLVERLGKRVKVLNGNGYMAMPFYQNISVMAVQKERLATALELLNKTGGEAVQCDIALNDWKQLQRLAQEWEKQGNDYIFFSCPLAHPETTETYNCVFFEILQTLTQAPEDGETNTCSLRKWLGTLEALQAATIFRDLFRRSHRREQLYFENNRKQAGERTERKFTDQFDSNEQGPVLWRHWYNTLSEMMSDLHPDERSRIKVGPLPGKKSSAGEWYLAVPAYSAAPELAWQLIRMITSSNRELERIYHGVGLPTRSAYYRVPARPADTGISAVSPFFHMSRPVMAELVEKAFTRSRFPCYQKMTDTIAAHLQLLLESSGTTHGEQSKAADLVGAVMKHLLESIDYIHETTHCPKCQNGSEILGQWQQTP